MASSVLLIFAVFLMEIRISSKCFTWISGCTYRFMQFFLNTNIIIYCTFLSKFASIDVFKLLIFKINHPQAFLKSIITIYFFYFISCFCWRKDVCVHNLIDQWTSSLLICRFLFTFYPVTYWLRSFDVVDIYCWSPSSDLIYLSKFRGFFGHPLVPHPLFQLD